MQTTLDNQYDFFISYRRDGGSELARLLHAGLRKRGYRPFLDVENLGAEFFDERLLAVINNSDCFLIILSPGCLDRCSNPDDWVRRELSHAFRQNKRVVPVILEEFSYKALGKLPDEIADLPRCNGIPHSHYHFDSVIEKAITIGLSVSADSSSGSRGHEAHQAAPALISRQPNNLKLDPDRFFGRDGEISRLLELLNSGQRLISIIGSGGYGKSRLSRELLMQAQSGYTHGVFIVELESIRDAAGIPSAIADVVGFTFFGERSMEDQLATYLSNKRMLLCLDNFEHVLDGRSLIESVLRQAPGIQFVVTSREPLRIRGEQVFQLDALPVCVPSVPDNVTEDGQDTTGNEHDKSYADALLLFADRASQVDHGFALSADNADAVAGICRILGGIPLAIELAAAWMDSFTLTELREELAKQLELESRFEDVPGRHRSLRASLDWSWRLLSADQQLRLTQMSAFRGGACASSVEAVLGIEAGKVRLELATLLEKGWLRTVRDSSSHVQCGLPDTRLRWYMRDPVCRGYAHDRLENVEPAIKAATLTAHAHYYSRLVGTEGPRLGGDGTGQGQLTSLATFEAELGNITEAITTLLDQLTDSSVKEDALPRLLTITRWLWWYAELKGIHRGIQPAYRRILDRLTEGVAPELKGWVLLGLANTCLRLGEVQESAQWLQDCLTLAEEEELPHLELITQHLTGNLNNSQGHLDEARACYEAALVLSRELGDRHGEGLALNNLGILNKNLGRREEAEQCLEASLRIMRELGDRRVEGSCVLNLGILYKGLGQWQAAARCYEASLDIRRIIGDRRGEGISLLNLGILHKNQGNLDRALECYEASLAIKRELGDRRGEGINLLNIGNLFKDQGERDRANEYYQNTLRLFNDLQDRYSVAMVLDPLIDLQMDEGELTATRESLEQYQVICEDLNLTGNLVRLHAMWARYWLAAADAGNTGSGAAEFDLTPSIAGDRAVSHLNRAREYATTNESIKTAAEEELLLARQGLSAFAIRHGLAGLNIS